MDRNQAPNSEKWDFSLIIKNDNEYNEIFECVKKQAQKLTTFKGKLKNKKDYMAFTNLFEEFSKNVNKLSLFIFLRRTINNKDAEIIAKDQEFSFFVEKEEKDLSFVAAEQKKFTNSYIDELAAEPKLESYKQDILDIKEDKKHILPEEQEKLLTGAGSFSRASEIFSNLSTSELVFESVKMPNGKKKKLDENVYSLFMTNKNASVRKQAMLSVLNAYKKHNLSIASNYISHLKACDFFSTSAKFESTFERRFYNDKINTRVYDNLIASVHKNLPLFYAWAKTRAKIMGAKITVSDFSNPLFALPNKKYSYDQAIEVVKQATAVFGKDYTKGLESLTSGGYVDVYPTENKEKGAFEVSNHEGKQFVMLNFVGNFDSVETMAHEFGHAMHSHYSEISQPYNLRDYNIFVAEIASTVNEILLMEHMKQNAKSTKEKFAYTEKLLDMAKGVIFTQTMFSEFEYFAHSKINQKQPLTFKDLNEKYMELNKLFFGKNVKIYPENAYGWSRIPHFYRPFYVYKYATGMLAAMLIVKRIKENPAIYVPKYKQFLSAGCSEKPIDILKFVDINFETEESFNEAFELYGLWIKEYKEGAKC